MSRISWNANQQKRLKNAVRRYNRQVKKMQESGLYDFVPEPTTYSKEKSRIYSRQQLYTRERQLNRIKNTGAANQVEYEGSIIPAYLRNEIRYTIRNINKGRQDFRIEHFPEGLSDIEFATIISGTNLADIDNSGYLTGQDLEDLIAALYPDISKRVNMYLALFQDNMSGYEGYDETLYVISQMAEKYPDKLYEIFESNLEEVDIGYIYPANPVPEVPGVTRSFTVEGKVYNYKAQAANQTSENIRVENVTDFWKYVGNKYLNTNYHINSNKLERFENDDILNNLTFKPRKRQSRR